MPLPKKISASLFGLILICFSLPFVTVSCENRPVVQMSGVDLTIGKLMTVPSGYGMATETQYLPPDLRAILAFGCVVVGLVASLIAFRRTALIRTVAAGLGALLLLFLKAGLDDALAKESIKAGGLASFSADYEMGFWGAFILFISAAIYNGRQFFQRRAKPPVPETPEPQRIEQ